MKTCPRGARFALLLTLVWPLFLLAQEPDSAQPAPTTTIRVNTRLVVIDVIVTDKHGNPVSDLGSDDFVLLEDGKPQRISGVSLPAPPGSPAAPASRASGAIGDRPSGAPAQGPLTLLLLDGLNTPEQLRISSSDSILDYLKKNGSLGPNVAVLTLTTDLRLLQGFTADPVLLRAAIERFGSSTNRPSRAITSNSDPGEPDANSSDLDLTSYVSPNNPGAALLVAMEARQRDLQAQRDEALTNSRVETTLAGLRAIARFAAGYPGRKNLVWVSAGFPVSLVAPAPNGSGNLTATRSYAAEIATTAALLSNAQIAVYPVNPGGLGSGYYSAYEEGELHEEWEIDVQRRESGLSALREMAAQTGGEAYLQRNDIGAAVSQATADGAHSYTVAYYPANKNWDGRYRQLQVKVKRPGLHLRYRPGYYAVDFSQPAGADPQKERLQDLRTVLLAPVPATMVVFNAKVTANPGPPSDVAVQFTVTASSVSFLLTAGGREHCGLDFAAAVFSSEGKMVASRAVVFTTDLKPEEYQAAVRQGLPFTLKLEVPPGEYLLRLAVRDEGNGYLGSTQRSLKVGNSPAGAADGK